MNSEKGKKDKNQNIQVFVRLRPLNQREKDIKSLGVVEVINNKEVVVRQSQQTLHTKKFTFDRAFGPHAKQVEVYQNVVSPLIEEVLAGYNCTVFAYGQTGTGKTHTMVGESCSTDTTWQNDPMSGIIPRALSQLFDELRLTNTEYNVRVSYLELYNEELFDLLSSSEDNSKLRIYEDITRKGANIVNGLEEITVYNKNEVYKIMSRGQERKRVASTLMNAQSSRSHTVFTIVVHMKENSAEGEELVKIGKLNLVDLAGSENISKAGSDNPAKRERARECVNINQSLLTLGRVITALVERHPHIPYRESKLTRILQESLGGRTKTSIIATISPGHKDLEETMSTLEYAHRAKNIQNKPEINQKMTKKAILKEFAEEIDRLKRDLMAARDKNGVYLANETFAEMTLKQDEQLKEIQELILKKRHLEEERDRMESVFAELDQRLKEKDSELGTVKDKLRKTVDRLDNTTNILKTTQVQYEEQKYLVMKREETERALSEQARELLNVADSASQHLDHLHNAVDKRKSVETRNLEITKNYRERSTQQRNQIDKDVKDFAETLKLALMGLQSTLENYTTQINEDQLQNILKIEALTKRIENVTCEVSDLSIQSKAKIGSTVTSIFEQLKSMLQDHTDCVGRMLAQFVNMTSTSLEHARTVDAVGQIQAQVQQWYTALGERVSCMRRVHESFSIRARSLNDGRRTTADSRAAARRDRLHRWRTQLHAAIQDMEACKTELEKSVLDRLAEVELEKAESEARLAAWVEDERRSFENRLARRVQEETRTMQQAADKRIALLQGEKNLLEQHFANRIEWLQQQLEANEEDINEIQNEMNETEAERDQCSQHMQQYCTKFDEGASAVSSDLDAFSGDVVHLVTRTNEAMIRLQQQIKDYIELEVKTAMEKDQVAKSTLNNSIGVALNSVVQATEEDTDMVISKIKSNGETTIAELQAVGCSGGAAMEQMRVMCSEHAASVGQSRGAVERMQRAVSAALSALHQLEGQHLQHEYKVYSPTGKTPCRQPLRYPRVLAATSPHHRLLERLRASRDDPSQDCMVVECEAEEGRVSDSESSVSEDSAAPFAVPSPPLDRAHVTSHSDVSLQPTTHPHKAIVKCTSESDIYVITRDQQKQGKENADRSIQYKKQSRLPAPSSNKKPLGTYNNINNR